MERDLQVFIRQRAGYCCEYCRLPETTSAVPFHLDHIIAMQHEGRTAHDNIALACGYCNRYKGPNLTGVDPDSNVVTPLFNPREHDWEKHFAWNGSELVGLTPVGRATVRLLRINRPAAVELRNLLRKEGDFVRQPMAIHEPGAEYHSGL